MATTGDEEQPPNRQSTPSVSLSSSTVNAMVSDNTNTSEETTKSENKKNLPQIQSENELIAQIVRGVKEMAEELEKPSSKLLKSSTSAQLDNSGSNDKLPPSPPSTSAAVHETFQSRDFTRETAMKLEIPKLSPNGTVVEMKDFASRVFKRLREMSNITSDSYKESWNLDPEQMIMKTGAGRSGSLFLFSKDKRFIFKTIPHEEVENFLLLLPDYFKYISENPDSLIMRVYGLHRFKYAFNSQLYIIVFGNVMHAPQSMDEIYDLKGRKAKPGKSLRNKGKTGIVFKDNDLDRRFDLGPNKEAFVKQLEADVNFLSSHNMMDYSFLVGVIKGKEGCPNDGFLRGKYQGMLTTSGDEVYYMGIIDCLTSYTSKKKAANFFKTKLWKPEELSTVDPPFYGSRFFKFMAEIFD